MSPDQILVRGGPQWDDGFCGGGVHFDIVPQSIPPIRHVWIVLNIVGVEE